ncbi:MAG: RNase J family beta-CASP ribonuclease [Nanoarchaeota archaeon]|nr:RNase J family beta-CASP ribonuclease [Nanoarchaeota archaeon]
MVVQIFAVGGYSEIGRNMTAIKVDDEVVICDMGIHLENYIRYTEDEDISRLTKEELIEQNAIPDISVIEGWKDKVKAIIPTHAHLDHIGAIPFLSDEFNAPIICTPFSAAVVNAILKDARMRIRNKILVLNPNSTYRLSENITIEFINITHSTPQTVMIAIHTKYGTIIYANDFKLDMEPTLGKKPDFARLKKLGDSGVLALIVDSTYAYDERKMPSESVAKQMLKDVLLGTDATGKIIFVTTFSSHLARLKSIIEFGKKLNRKIIFAGRSLAKYVKAGEETAIINFSKDVEIVSFGNKIPNRLRRISDSERGKYMVVVTGHQGESKAVLSRIASGSMGFKLKPGDHIVFSCTTIPTETNRQNRKVLEDMLKKHKVRIFKDIHVSGHAAREDLRDLFNMVRPKNIIPAHGDLHMTTALKDLAEEMDYKNVYQIKEGECITIQK